MSDDPAKAPESTEAEQRHKALAEAGKPYRWQKGGPSPNPGGKPARRRFKEALEAYFETHPEDFAEVIERVVKDAKIGKDADPGRKFLRDTIDGPLETRLAGADGEKLQVDVTMVLHETPEKTSR